MADKRLVPQGIRDLNTEAFNTLIDRLGSLDLTPLLIYIIDNVHASALPHLAEQFHITGLEGWQFAKSEKEKRELIKNAINIHRLKGTPAGVKFAAKQAGSKVLRIIEPPQKFFCSPALTKEEKNRWLRQMPQLRIYPVRKRGEKQGFLGWRDYCGNTYFLKTDAMFRMMARAVLVKDGKKYDLITSSYETEMITKKVNVEVYIPGKAGYASFLNRALLFVARTDASNRSIMIKETVPYIEEKRKLSIQTLKPQHRFIKADADWVSEPSVQRSMFIDSAKNFYPARTDAGDRLCWVYYIFDPQKTFHKHGSTYLGVNRLGMTHHTCEILLDLIAKKRLFRFCNDIAHRNDKSKMFMLFQVIQKFNRASVHPLVDTRKYKPIKASYVITASEQLKAGQYREVA